MDWLCIHMHNVYDVQSAAPPLVDISINRVHIALVPAQLVVPEHWSFSRAGLVFRNKVKFYCRHSAFTYTADPTYRYCSGTTMAMWTRPYLVSNIVKIGVCLAGHMVRWQIADKNWDKDRDVFGWTHGQVTDCREELRQRSGCVWLDTWSGDRLQRRTETKIGVCLAGHMVRWQIVEKNWDKDRGVFGWTHGQVTDCREELRQRSGCVSLDTWSGDRLQRRTETKKQGHRKRTTTAKMEGLSKVLKWDIRSAK